MDTLIQMILLFGLPLLKEGTFKINLGIAHYASNVRVHENSTLSTQQMTMEHYPVLVIHSQVVSDQLDLHSSGSTFLQISLLLQQFFQC